MFEPRRAGGTELQSCAECCAAAQWWDGAQSAAGASAGAVGARWLGPTRQQPLRSRLDNAMDSSAAAAALLWLRRVRDGLS